ncbi:hypothetical protein [Streptomyces sp.]|uniref:hypothetical protein n=1 Tax=Streptomyces sp. TaxID=1931 RepID=UPI002D22BC67|nr:hypothetical protein [Streptomyces sp.]HZF87837.1 hypothetical protein [Streptomyces sp.]
MEEIPCLLRRGAAGYDVPAAEEVFGIQAGRVIGAFRHDHGLAGRRHRRPAHRAALRACGSTAP